MMSSQTIWVIIGVVFLTYFAVSWVYKGLGVVNLEKALFKSDGLRLLNLQHALGIVLFGVLFYLLMPQYRHLIGVIEMPSIQILIPYIALLALCAWISRTSASSANHFNEKQSHYNSSDGWVYFSLRFVFLLCYEFFFRGVLLLALIEQFGLIQGIGYCTFAYLIIHLFDSKKEIIGTIPFGIVLCILTYETQYVWYAFLMHLVLSAVYELSIFHHQTLKT
ncbi:CPBP family intramembrane metalloprotease [Hyunsoonleella sp. SJ7]|uniref:CPBP family intramembrane metalloprotease n=1 Tax=Hyunsoonleella aquatilis TaxID=2762758 RepID=A0A923KJY4_9FLAO|nr:CPBP family intramembrane glutamic endopeptidase [Hyunsoonleella aquatilis]MBC3757223.1 CPBP family intramembrane metalloprotease [Hyunsoonleella aquatilis]